MYVCMYECMLYVHVCVYSVYMLCANHEYAFLHSNWAFERQWYYYNNGLTLHIVAQ